ncbi:MAG: carbohydrate porin, partial [Candidatus Omnitrophota bacterium]
MIRKILGVLIVGLYLLTTVSLCAAVENVPVGETSWFGSWFAQQTATGNWGGLRQNLVNKGVSLTANYTTDILGNPVGGLKQAVRYAGFLQVMAALDFEKMASFQGWALTMSNYVASGSNLSSEIGNFYGVQEIYSPGSYYFGVLDFSFSLPGDVLTLEAGRLFAGDVFATSSLWQYYVSSINSNIVSISSNIFFPHFQVAAWGARASYNSPDNKWQFISGIYDANPNVGDPDKYGLDFSFDDSYGCLAVSQLTYKHHQGRQETGLAGSAAFGGYYDSNKFAGVVESDRFWHGNYGFYFIVDQMIYRG